MSAQDDNVDLRIAFTDSAEQARQAVKLLINNGFSAEKITVICNEEVRKEKFRTEVMPSGSPQPQTATSLMAVAGGCLGAVAAGVATLAGGPVIAVGGAAAGAAVGGTAGSMLGAAIASNNEADNLSKPHQERLDRGGIGVAVDFTNITSETQTKQGMQILEELDKKA